jgi:hypothetical protein
MLCAPCVVWLAASRSDVGKTLLLDEVNGMGAAFLRVEFLPEFQQAETRKLLKKYVDLRSDQSRHREKLPLLLVDSEALHAQLWAQVTSPPSKNDQPVLESMMNATYFSPYRPP